jgi:hypothetical protein
VIVDNIPGMGWGNEPHEGFDDARRADGTWTGGTSRGPADAPVAKQAVCSCGWRSERVHEIGPRSELPGPAREAWFELAELAGEQCHEDWLAEHYEPLLGYEPHTMLIEGESPGGRRHFLDGRPVHAGTGLDLLLPDGRWQRVRYKWGFASEQTPRVYMQLGGPAAAERLDAAPQVSFDLRPRAVLRWPERSA